MTRTPATRNAERAATSATRAPRTRGPVRAAAASKRSCHGTRPAARSRRRTVQGRTTARAHHVPAATAPAAAGTLASAPSARVPPSSAATATTTTAPTPARASSVDVAVLTADRTAGDRRASTATSSHARVATTITGRRCRSRERPPGHHWLFRSQSGSNDPASATAT
ncbi:hypothetical protein [Cellulosimicrobium funkei]|uniref:hypothetical protein n=1 Tax=Cellulosimicrobium funkei TaxID=264251 RepID=UPI003D71A6D8